jgi:hypothetical protein
LVVASSPNSIVGPGLVILDTFGNPSFPGKNFEYSLNGALSANLADARTNDDYIEYTFNTLATYTADTGRLANIAFGTQGTRFGDGSPSGADNFTYYDVSVEVSLDGFATPGIVILQDFFVNRDDSGYNFRQTGFIGLELLPNTTYTFRFYIYNDVGTGNSGGNGQFDSIGRVTFDDLFFGITTENFNDTDGDGINDHQDLDSDNDGISDLFESGPTSVNVNLLAADLNADGTISLAESISAGSAGDADIDGLMDIFELEYGNNTGTSPIDSFDIAGDGLVDYLDLDSDDDTIPDTVEARPTLMFAVNDGLVDTNDDLDNDGVINLFDSNDAAGALALFGGTHPNFNNPVNTDAAADGPDFLDLDSDNDTEGPDLVEGEVQAAGGSPITIPPSYQDPDGSVNNPLTNVGPADLLENDDSDNLEVDYRSLNLIPGFLGDSVWFDVNGDGVQDLAEPPITGATIKLLDGLGNPVFQDPVSGLVVNSTFPGAVPYLTVTDASGSYLFQNLPAGDYIVMVDISTLSPGFSPTFDFDGAGDKYERCYSGRGR